MEDTGFMLCVRGVGGIRTCRGAKVCCRLLAKTEHVEPGRVGKTGLDRIHQKQRPNGGTEF